MSVARRFALAAIGLVLATQLVAPGASAEIDWAAQQHIQPNTTVPWFRTGTNATVFSGATSLGGAQSAFNPQSAPTTEEYNTGGLQVVWSGRCEPVDEQTAVFKRTINLPGDNSKLFVNVGSFSESKVNPIKSVEIQLNGVSLHKAVARDKPIPIFADKREVVAAPGNAPRFGKNTITVIGVKQKTSKKLGLCGPDAGFGVVAEIYGEFRADVTRGAGATDAGGTTTSQTFNVPTFNKGPTDLVSPPVGYFVFSAVSSTVDVQSLSVGGGDALGCQTSAVSANGAEGLRVLCLALGRIARGATRNLSVTFTWNPAIACPGSTASITISMFRGGWGETLAQQQNNGGSGSISCL